jgi:hypothetical protein
MHRNICILYLSYKTQCEHTILREMKIFASRRYKCVQRGTRILLINKDAHQVVGVGIADGTFEMRDLLNIDVFSGRDSQYNRFEAPMKSFRWFSTPISLTTLSAMCGGPAVEKAYNNITKCTMLECAKPFYKNENGPAIIEKLRMLVETWA